MVDVIFPYFECSYTNGAIRKMVHMKSYVLFWVHVWVPDTPWLRVLANEYVGDLSNSASESVVAVNEPMKRNVFFQRHVARPVQTNNAYYPAFLFAPPWQPDISWHGLPTASRNSETVLSPYYPKIRKPTRRNRQTTIDGISRNLPGDLDRPFP